MDIRLSVAAGVELLHKKLPGWFNTIETADLDLEECANCVIGQLYGKPFELFQFSEFTAALKGLGVSPYNAFAFGFDVEDADQSPEVYDELREEWVSRIEELVNAPGGFDESERVGLRNERWNN